jgi:hypothetical protein
MIRISRKQIGLVGLGLVVIGLGIWWVLTPEPQRIRPANVGIKSFSVGWFTKKPSKSCVLAIGSVKPNEWLIKCEKEARVTHLVGLDKAEPERYYTIVVVDWPRVTVQELVTVMTGAISSQPLRMPQPGYGSVISPEGFRVPGALVYLTPSSREFNYPVAAMTNELGNFAVDIGKVSDKSDGLLVEAIGNMGIWSEGEVSSKYTAPLPTITVKIK